MEQINIEDYLISLKNIHEDSSHQSNDTSLLEFYLRHVIHILHVQLHVYDENDNLTMRLSSTLPSADPLANDAKFLSFLLEKAKQEGVFLCSDHGPIVYGGLFVENHSVILGPVAIGTPDHNIAELHSIYHHCTNAYITKGDIPSFASTLIMLYSIFTGKRMSLNKFIMHSFLNSTVLKSLEQKITEITALNMEGQPHHPLSMETRVLDNIRLGDPDNLLKSLDYPYPGRRGTLASDPLRSEKNIGIIDVSLAARAAISGGLEVEDAYIVADAFILEVEEAKTPQEVFAVKSTAQMRFAQMVQDAVSKQNVGVGEGINNDDDVNSAKQLKLIASIKNYVKRNINNKLTIGSICEDLKVSGSYLQHVFRQCEGITLMRYCRKEKVKVAAQLLRNSDYSIAEITDMLNFCSKSHFTQIFKLENGETPDVYRLKNKITI